MKRIVAAGNTVVPAILALEALGFAVESDKPNGFRARRADETYIADDPVMLLGLVKLIECRGWQWEANDTEVDATLERFAPD